MTASEPSKSAREKAEPRKADDLNVGSELRRTGADSASNRADPEPCEAWERRNLAYNQGPTIRIVNLETRETTTDLELGSGGWNIIAERGKDPKTEIASLRAENLNCMEARRKALARSEEVIMELHARIAELERENTELKIEAYGLGLAIGEVADERDSARVALQDLVYQSEWFESCAEEGSDAWKAYAEARRVLSESPPRADTAPALSDRSRGETTPASRSSNTAAAKRGGPRA